MESTDFMRGWLQAFFDGEGTVYLSVYPTKRRSRKEGRGRVKKTVARAIRVNNTDRVLIDTCASYLSELGIEFRITSVIPRNPRYKLQWALVIGKGTSLARYAELIGFASPSKAAVLSSVHAWVTRDRSHQAHRDIQLKLVL